MTGDSIVNVTAARAKMNQLIDEDSFAISRHGKIVGVYLSKDRIEALIETTELLGNPEFTKALNEHKSGRMKFYQTAELDKAMVK
jgi:PHD/YefM family antitoxin component YafN of YafNO toxin-antitoxin module